jgi:peptidoglycan hydrolase CwlO-like protein
MEENESIVNNVDKLIESTYSTIKSVGVNSDQIFSQLAKLFEEIKSQQNDQSIPELFKKQKITQYLEMSKNFDNEIEKIFEDIESKKAYFKSEAAEEK